MYMRTKRIYGVIQERHQVFGVPVQTSFCGPYAHNQECIGFQIVFCKPQKKKRKSGKATIRACTPVT